MIEFKFNRSSMCDGYDIVREGDIIGFIDVAGSFRNKESVVLTEEERTEITKMCKRVYERPTEWGVLGVGESPTEPFDEFLQRHPNWISF